MTRSRLIATAVLMMAAALAAVAQTSTSQPTSKPSSRPATKAASGPLSKAASQPTTKVASQPATRPASKPATATASRPSSKPATGTASRPATGPTSRPTTTTSSAPATKPATKPAPKPPPKPVKTTRKTGPAGPDPHINYLFPAGGQRGKTISVTISGLNLEKVAAPRISGDDVSAQVVKEVDPETLDIAVTITPQAKPGIRDLRVVTPIGVSNRFRFVVGEIPELNEVEPNSRKEQAQALPALPVTVNGQVMGGDRDIYSFTAKAGQTLLCRVQACDLLPFIADAVPGWAQLTLTIYDESGKELAYDDDFRFHPDPVLIFPVPSDGKYTVEVKDALFRGREDFVYRLSVGELPFITEISPLGAKRGSTTQVQLHGVNLDQQSLDVKLTDDSPLLTLLGCASASGLASNLLPFVAGDLDEIAEPEPNDTPEQAQKIAPPVTINGLIDRPGDVDCYCVSVEAKQVMVFEVRARRLGSPLDSIITVLDAKGQRIAQNDDWVDDSQQILTHHADSRLAVTFPAKGDYFVRVADAQGKGGPQYAYRLTAGAPRGDFYLQVTPDNPRLAPGDTAVVSVAVIRRDFDGEVRLTLEGLGAGFAASGLVVPPKENLLRFTITAPADVAAGVFQPRITGAAQIDGKTVTRQAQPCEQVMQAFAWMHRVPTEEMLLMVAESSPFVLSTSVPAGQALEAPQGGEAQVTVKVARKADSPGAINVTADQPPKAVAARFATIAQDKDETTVTLTISKQAPVGSVQNVILVGTMRSGKDTLTAYAPAIPVKIMPAPATKPATATATASQPATASRPATGSKPATASRK